MHAVFMTLIFEQKFLLGVALLIGPLIFEQKFLRVPF